MLLPKTKILNDFYFQELQEQSEEKENSTFEMKIHSKD